MKDDKKKNILMIGLFVIIVGLIVVVIIASKNRGMIIRNDESNNIDTLLTEDELKKEIGAYNNSDMLSSEILSISYETKEIEILGTTNKVIDGNISLNDKITKNIENDKIIDVTGIGYQPSADVILFLLTKNKDVYYINYKTYEDINSDIKKIDINNMDRLVLVNLEQTYVNGNEMYAKGDKIKKSIVYAEKNKKLINLLDYVDID